MKKQYISKIKNLSICMLPVVGFLLYPIVSKAEVNTSIPPNSLMGKVESNGSLNKIESQKASVNNPQQDGNNVSSSNSNNTQNNNEPQQQRGDINQPQPSNQNNNNQQTNANKSVDLQKGSVLNNNQVKQIDNVTTEELLKKEVNNLNGELDNLHKKLNQLKKENEQLKVDLDKLNQQNSATQSKESEVQTLTLDAKKLENSIDQNSPTSYVNAYNLLIIGNLDLAEGQFKQYLKGLADTSSNSGYKLNDGNKRYIVLSNYFLGRINNINAKYKDAVNNFVNSYRLSDFNAISLLSLIGLAKSLTHLSNNKQACIALSQFDQDYAKFTNNTQNKLDDKYIDLVKKLKDVNQCSVTPTTK